MIGLGVGWAGRLAVSGRGYKSLTRMMTAAVTTINRASAASAGPPGG